MDAKKEYNKAKAGRIHAEQILDALERTREKLEESITEIDDKISAVVQERKEFERLELKLLNHTISPWLQ